MSKQPKSHLKRLATFDYINSAILLLVAVCCVYPFLYASMKHGFAALRFARALRIIPKCPATVDNLHDCPAVFAAGHFW